MNKDIEITQQFADTIVKVCFDTVEFSRLYDQNDPNNARRIFQCNEDIKKGLKCFIGSESPQTMKVNIPIGNEFDHFLVANLIDIFIIQFRRSLGYDSISFFDLNQIFYTTILVNPYSAWYIAAYKNAVGYTLDVYKSLQLPFKDKDKLIDSLIHLYLHLTELQEQIK